MQPDGMSHEISMKGAAFFFPRANLLSFLVCGDHEMGDRAFLLADREEQSAGII